MRISVKFLLKIQNIVSHSQKIGNTNSNFLWNKWRTMPENGQSEKKEVDTL
jgi:hypothetical protein